MITATVERTRVATREHMLAAGEMQLSGEPLAEAMGRRLQSYSRFRVPADVYLDAQLQLAWLDPAGYSTAIESYEYSKQPMNNLMFESGAGTSLAYGPLVADLAALERQFAAGSHALGRFPLAGMWPTCHVYASFDPAIDPSPAVHTCAISSDDNPGVAPGTAVTSPDYECDATSLRLRDRRAQIDTLITPGADGFSAWKYGLWVMNYLQSMHDLNEGPVSSTDDLALVGTPDNKVRGTTARGVLTKPGTYLGSSDLEGFQAQMFILSVDNRAEDWLAHLSTDDGKTLSGFADAMAYAYDSVLRWFPTVRATEDAQDRPSYALASPDVEVMDLIGLAMGYAELYALVDPSNRAVGASPPVRAVFDGDPFAPEGLRRRALGIIRVAMIDLDRMHARDGIFVDKAVSTTTVAYALIGLRTVLRALGGQLELYSNNQPDTAISHTPLDALPLHYPGDPALTFSGRLEQLVRAHAALLYDHLTDASGRASEDSLDAHAAAVRGLFAAYLATGDTRYRTRAVAVFDRMDRVFFAPDARIYAPPGATSVQYTPLRFALVQSALRDVYELVARRPGGEARMPLLEDRLARLDKLVLNGWDDRDDNRIVDYPRECVRVVDGVPRGGLQAAERTLTGETGGTADRDRDCVPEIDDAHLPAGLVDAITFHWGDR